MPKQQKLTAAGEVVQQQNQRYNFSKSRFKNHYPNLLDLPKKPFQQLFEPGATQKERKQSGLHHIFKNNFPIAGTKGNFTLEYIDHVVTPPCYTPRECKQRGITYDATLRATFKLTCVDKDGTRVTQEEIYLCNIPCMTPRGTFIYKGIERVIISQLQRSYGVFFSENRHPNGAVLYSAKIIPKIGTWTELNIDQHNTLYVYLDRRRKIPATVLLRILGYGTDKEILELFNLAEEIPVTKKSLTEHKGRILAETILETREEDIVDPETGVLTLVSRHEVVIDRNTIITDEVIDTIIQSDQKKVMLLKENASNMDHYYIYNTLQKDNTDTEQEAYNHIYYQIRKSEPPEDRVARETVKQYIFGSKKSFVGKVGRHTLNKKLGLKTSPDQHQLTPPDLIATIKKFGDLISGKKAPEDIDSLANRIVLLASNHYEVAFERGLKLTIHYIKETLRTRGDEELTPTDVVQGHHIVSTMNTFFSLDPNSQYMEETNLLSGIEHTRRISKIKAMHRERASFGIRDVHETQKRKLCPINTAEGLNLGLSSQPALCAQTNSLGYLQSTYKKIIKGKVDTTRDYYLTAAEEEEYTIGEYTDAIDQHGNINQPKINVQQKKDGSQQQKSPQEIEYIDTRNDQFYSPATALIPFLSHTEGNRGLMGSNMQRQAVPLFKPQAPIIGTGKERQIAHDTNVLLKAEREGTIEYVDADRIVIQYHYPAHLEKITYQPGPTTYRLARLQPTNQGTNLTETPIVKKGDKVKKGQLLVEGYGTENGELALGANLNIAFMPYNGYSFEDSIVISERVVRDDLLTSIHIEKHTVDLYNTKLGPEEFTADIPNTNAEALKQLDERGIVRVGTEVKEGDILVGKITPQSEETPTSESKIMAALFGNLAESVKHTSFKVPFAGKGTVISTQILEGQEITAEKRKQIKQQMAALKEATESSLEQLRDYAVKTLLDALKEKAITIPIQNLEGETILAKGQKITRPFLEEEIFHPIKKTKYQYKVTYQEVQDHNWTDDPTTNQQIAYLFDTYQKEKDQALNHYKREQKKIQVGHELKPGILKQAVVYLAQKCKIEVGDKISGRHGNKGVIGKVARQEDMPYLEDGTPIDIIFNSLSLPSRMNIGQLLEAILGWAGYKLGKKYTVPIFREPSIDKINGELKEAELPTFGRTTLYDGFTSQPFREKVTVGNMYVIKLHHLVRSKVHARETGPTYALINQQPLGGRSRGGGQRFGAMEAWALEAYGASHILQELYTLKSDDIVGRQKTQEAIYKGTTLPKPGVPETVKILKQYLAGLSIDLDFKA